MAGDGGMQMNMQELVTAAVYELPLIICVFNNGRLGNVRQWQEMFYNQRYAHTCLGYHRSCEGRCGSRIKGQGGDHSESGREKDDMANTLSGRGEVFAAKGGQAAGFPAEGWAGMRKEQGLYYKFHDKYGWVAISMCNDWKTIYGYDVKKLPAQNFYT